MYCNGCAGRGWVDSKVIGPTLCPVCKGDGMKNSKEPIEQEATYDQDAIWINLKKNIPVSLCEKIKIDGMNIDKKIKPEDSYYVVIHMLFDKSISPQGNLIFHHLQNQTITGPKQEKLSRDQIVARGYDVDSEGEIRTWNDVPVSPALFGLIKWCQNESSIRSFEIDANRKGNPCFCDDDMLAIIISPREPCVFYTVDKMLSFLYEEHYLKTINVHLHLLA
jgi:hypothetical protein